MIHDVFGSVQDSVLAIGAVFIALTGVYTGWQKWLGPGIRKVNEAVVKSIAVFDMMLQTHQLPGEDGEMHQYDLPAALAHIASGNHKTQMQNRVILDWITQHNDRWPPEPDHN